ncbi:Uncharacterised protein [Moellerella wisconsensis]|nr:Uncharacterised protein [Moellerella wisconsensis]
MCYARAILVSSELDKLTVKKSDMIKRPALISYVDMGKRNINGPRIKKRQIE